MSTCALGNLWAWTAQVGVIVAGGGLLVLGLRITSPRVRAVLLRSILGACLALPVIQPWIPSPMPVADSTRTAIDVTSGLPAGATTVQRPDESGFQAWVTRWRSPAKGWPLETMVISMVVAGAVLRIGWLALGVLSLSRLRRQSSESPPGLRAALEAAALVGASAPIHVSTRVVRPVTFGLRDPVVLVPPDFLSFDPVHQTAILAHEFLHVRRHDWIQTVVDELVRSVLWFHPAIWWLIEHIQLSVEQVIDRQVVQLIGGRKPYLEALLKLAAAGRSPMLQPAASFLKHGHLARRVALLVQEVAMSRVRLGVSVAVVLTVLVAGGWCVVQAFPLRVSSAAPTVTGLQRDTVTLEFEGADIRAVLQSFAAISGHEMKIAPEISGSIDLSVRDVPWEQALEFVCRSKRLVYRVDGTVIRVEGVVNSAIRMSSGSSPQFSPNMTAGLR
jgi:beta-lactamase regulating signal transducer with metallopeptidase domain